MRIAILALAAALAVSPAFASDSADIASTINKYNDSFNRATRRRFVTVLRADHHNRDFTRPMPGKVPTPALPGECLDDKRQGQRHRQ
jgi:hypothetical protein